MSIDDVLEEIEKDTPFYGEDGGMTLSGGEPLFQSGFALCLLTRCHEKGISTVLDTSGYASPEIVKQAMGYTDMVLLDLKHMDPEMHKQGTGVDNALILENARLMAEKTRVRISLPLIPDYNDSKENLSVTAQFALSLGVDHIDVNPLHILGSDKYTCLGLTPPYGLYRGLENNDVLRARDILEEAGLQVTIGRMM
jgi:pyruvate formate lyase activating enzyme